MLYPYKVIHLKLKINAQRKPLKNINQISYHVIILLYKLF